MKLHLGCGQRYLEGYLNIDFPLSKHSVQSESVADENHDITKLRYPTESIEEVRLHHVFEHFDRVVAAALMASWNSWLVEDGILHIEVPDFERSAKVALSMFSSKKNKKVAIRHLFGSHEAFWAIHAEGYSEWMLKDLLESMGFKVSSVQKEEWNGTFNLTIIANKIDSISKEECTQRAKRYFLGFLVDDSETENSLLEVWLKKFNSQLDINWAR